MTQLYNVGPDLIAEPGTTGGPGFALWRPEWVGVQASCLDARSLPTTHDAFRRSLGDGAPDDVSDFDDVVEVYRSMSAHATTWLESTFPAAVELAADVYRYGAGTAPAYYPPILGEAEVLAQDPDDAQARSALQTIFGALRTEAAVNAARAGTVAAVMAEFVESVESTQDVLVGSDDQPGLLRRHDLAGQRWGTAADLIDEIARRQQIVAAASTDYGHDVVRTAGTPTYAWVWPFGAVAAPVAAGVDGSPARSALVHGQQALESLGRLDAAPSAAGHLVLTLRLAESVVDATARDAAEVLPVVLRLQSVWNGIAADLDTLSTLVADDAAEIPAIVAELHVDEAIQSWVRVAETADAFRLRAYAREVPDATMAAWKVATQCSSTRAAAA